VARDPKVGVKKRPQAKTPNPEPRGEPGGAVKTPGKKGVKDGQRQSRKHQRPARKNSFNPRKKHGMQPAAEKGGGGKVKKGVLKRGRKKGIEQ